MHLMPKGIEAGEAPLAIGDSVMFAAARDLARRGMEVDVKEGRVMRAALQIMSRRRRAGTLPPVVVIALGTNLPLRPDELSRASRLAGPERRLVYVTPLRSWRAFGTAPIWRSQRLHPDQVSVADWAGTAAANPALLWSDGTHIRPTGRDMYTRLIWVKVRTRRYGSDRAPEGGG